MDEEKILEEIASLVYETSGVVFKGSNIIVLKSRLHARLKEKKLSLENYLKLLKNDKEELNSFVDFTTTNFTSFFRNEGQFEILREEILPLVVKNKQEKMIKLWSAGCSTGEEPYSMAMCVDDFLEKNFLKHQGWDYYIIASDISLQSLFVAKEAKFPSRSLEKIPSHFVNKYFDALDNSFVIVKDFLKKKVEFDFHNLIYDNGVRGVDITFCRNVLIYFDEEVQKKVLENIYTATNKGGFLFLGHSESLFGLYEKFKPISFPKGIVYVRD